MNSSDSFDRKYKYVEKSTFGRKEIKLDLDRVLADLTDGDFDSEWVPRLVEELSARYARTHKSSTKRKIKSIVSSVKSSVTPDIFERLDPATQKWVRGLDWSVGATEWQVMEDDDDGGDDDGDDDDSSAPVSVNAPSRGIDLDTVSIDPSVQQISPQDAEDEVDRVLTQRLPPREAARYLDVLVPGLVKFYQSWGDDDDARRYVENALDVVAQAYLSLNSHPHKWLRDRYEKGLGGVNMHTRPAIARNRSTDGYLQHQYMAGGAKRRRARSSVFSSSKDSDVILPALCTMALLGTGALVLLRCAR